MTTKSIRIYCSWCKSATDMYPAKMWWNFTDKSFADPIGYCSEECITQAKAQKELWLRKAGVIK